MLNLFKRKKNAPNKVFGDVKRFDNHWAALEKVDIMLWGRSYKLDCSIITGPNRQEITQLQEDIYIRFTEEHVAVQKRVEKIVSDYYGSTEPDVLMSKFEPYELMITPKGECAILAGDADDEDLHDVLPGLAVVIYPTMAIFTEEHFTEYVLLGKNSEIKEKLHGGA